ncbi:MAG: TlpA family protein disulfide reductase [Actinomycetota bacterium]
MASLDQTERSPAVERRGLPLVRWLAFVIVPTLFVGFLAYGLLHTRGAKSAVGSAAPAIDLPLLGGGRVTSAELAGKPLVVNFWASWCLPCREEAPALQRAWTQNRDGDLVVLGVNIQDGEEDARSFVEEFGITYPIARDVNLDLATKFGVRGLPETYFIDHTGRFRAIGSGKKIDTQRGTAVLGAITPAVLRSQVAELLELRDAARKAG